jgi:hypothetical protein
MVIRSPPGAAPAAQARRSITRVTAPALATRPRSAPARSRDSLATLGRGSPPRSADVAGSASSFRSDRKSPPANMVVTRAAPGRAPRRTKAAEARPLDTSRTIRSQISPRAPIEPPTRLVDDDGRTARTHPPPQPPKIMWHTDPTTDTCSNAQPTGSLRCC